jgi:hypothetical protein
MRLQRWVSFQKRESEPNDPYAPSPRARRPVQIVRSRFTASGWRRPPVGGAGQVAWCRI